MKKFLLFTFLACFGIIASAQKVYFLYLQTEDFAPFYIRVSDKIYSSSTAGYLILPNLVDTTYYLSVGFAKSTDPETKFSVAINGGDRGFLLKKFEDGLALFDFEQLSVVKSNAAEKDNTVYETKTDAFSNVLSKAANDPSIVKVPVVKKEEPKTEKKEEVIAKTEEQKPVETSLTQDSSTTQKENPNEPKQLADTAVAKTNDKVDTTQQQIVVETTKPQQTDSLKHETTALHESQLEEMGHTSMTIIAYKASVVSRYSESSTTEGFGIIYFDKSEEATDTIRILIPSSKVAMTADADTMPRVDLQTNKNAIDSSAQVTKKEIETKTVDTQTQTATENQVPKEPVFIESKSVCKTTATDKDFLKLRKKMAAQETDEAMIDEAKKDFKGKCYSVEQLRYLSTLFLTSAAKYQFFDAAYEHVSDKSNFASLGSEIKDDYYAKRFKALVGE